MVVRLPPTPGETGTAKSSPEAVGFLPDLGDRLEAGVRSGLLRDLHAVLVMRKGRPVLERYYEGPDVAWTRPLGPVAFGPETLHDLRSVTKSVVGLLYGIALDAGAVPPPEAPLLESFADYPDLAADPRRRALTIEHALTMSLGLSWDETQPYTGPHNSEVAMEMAPDRYRFVLEQPIQDSPGTRWTYSGGATALVAALIARGTGRPLQDFARDALFSPLGVEDFEWVAGRDGIVSAASGLRLAARDLIRVGTLVLDGGIWQGRQIVPKTWIGESLAPAIETGDGLSYGRFWFIGHGEAPAIGRTGPWMAGFGNGGQRLWIMPDLDLTAVIFCGGYNKPDAWVTPTRIWREIVLASLVKA